MAITPLAGNEISARDIKTKLNEIIGYLNGEDTTKSQEIVSAMLTDLGAVNVAAPGFYLNSGVVTQGSA